MLRFTVRRLAFMVVVLLGISVITFAVTHLIPGDPARLLAGPNATADQVTALRSRYGLDRPVVEQYLTYMRGLFTGDLGQSLTTHRAVTEDLQDFLPATLELTAVAVLLMVGLGVPLGVLAARSQGGISDGLIRIATILGVAMPTFWLGIILQLILFQQLHLLPLGGRVDLLQSPPPHATGFYLVDSLLAGRLDMFGSALVHLILPAITLAAGSLGSVVLLTRASVLETLGADYVRTARAKGLQERLVMRRHVLKNALLPTVSIIGLNIGWLLGGNVLVESVFNWPGLGLYAVTGIKNLAYSPVMAVTLIFATIYVLANLIVDLIYAGLNPRIAYK